MKNKIRGSSTRKTVLTYSKYLYTRMYAKAPQKCSDSSLQGLRVVEVSVAPGAPENAAQEEKHCTRRWSGRGKARHLRFTQRRGCRRSSTFLVAACVARSSTKIYLPEIDCSTAALVRDETSLWLQCAKLAECRSRNCKESGEALETTRCHTGFAVMPEERPSG